MVRTQFKANQVSGFNPGYYLGKNPDVGANFDHWFSQQPMNFGKYVRSHSDLENAWSSAYSNHPTPESRHSWGEKHWNKHGRGENRAMAYNVGDNYYLMSKGANDQSTKEAFGAWHFDRYGRNEGRFGNETSWYLSPGQQQIRDEAAAAQAAELAKERNELMAQLAADEAAAMQSAAEGAEPGRLASMRGGGSRTLSASGAATFKGKGLKSSENKRGKGRGTGQLRRPYGTSNLSIAAAGKGNPQSTLNL